MKASKLIELIQSQVDLYGDLDVEVINIKNFAYKSIDAVTGNTYGTIEIVIK